MRHFTKRQLQRTDVCWMARDLNPVGKGAAHQVRGFSSYRHLTHSPRPAPVRPGAAWHHPQQRTEDDGEVLCTRSRPDGWAALRS